MSKTRRARKPLPEKTQIPFLDAEEAWFWYMRTERVRREGAYLKEDATDTARPCDPDDIYRMVMKLRRHRRIGDAHLRVLAEYGWRETPPDDRVREEARAVMLWDDALDRLTTELKAKGIVSHEECTQRCG